MTNNNNTSTIIVSTRSSPTSIDSCCCCNSLSKKRIRCNEGNKITISTVPSSSFRRRRKYYYSYESNNDCGRIENVEKLNRRITIAPYKETEQQLNSNYYRDENPRIVCCQKRTSLPDRTRFNVISNRLASSLLCTIMIVVTIGSISILQPTDAWSPLIRNRFLYTSKPPTRTTRRDKLVYRPTPYYYYYYDSSITANNDMISFIGPRATTLLTSSINPTVVDFNNNRNQPKNESSSLIDSDVTYVQILQNNHQNDENGYSYSNRSFTLSRNGANVDDDEDEDDDDVPRPTENGGYTHTAASRAKISAANKGKVPWNKGKNRSEEVRARIAAGVRAKNRERFLQKLQSMGLTEEEYNQQQEIEKQRKMQEKLARKTEKGGYRLTNETKSKISKVLKEKYSTGEIKPRRIDPSSVRRGFRHTDETRRKISESLRQLWSTNDAYRNHMITKSTIVNTRSDIRQKISDSLKEKWKDPTFRDEMLSKFASSKQPSQSSSSKILGNSTRTTPGTLDLSHRERISMAMKLKWQDEEYRKKALQGFAARRSNTTTTNSTNRTRRSSKPKQTRPTTTTASKKSKSQQSSISSELHKNNAMLSMPRNFDAVNGLSKPSAGQAVNANDDEDGEFVVRMVQPLTKPRKKERNQKSQQQERNPMPDALQSPNKKTVSSVSSNPNKDMNTLNPSIIRNNGSKNGTPTSSRTAKGSLFGVDDADVTAADYLFFDKDVTDLDDDVIAGDDDDDFLFNDIMVNPMDKPTKTSSSSKTSNNNQGSVDRLQEERPDLYELLYGDDDDIINHFGSSSRYNDNNANNRVVRSPLLSSPLLGDENLDTFDPYGLDDH